MISRDTDAEIEFVSHLWWIHERVEELDPEEMGRRFAEPSFQEAMAYVQESLLNELKRSRPVTES